MHLIDEKRDKALDRLMEILHIPEPTYTLAEIIEEYDLEPVVRCKDCKHSYDAIGGTFCSYGTCVDCIVDEDFFCKNGERRDEECD